MTYNESPGRETPNFWINYYKILPCMCCMYTTYTLKTIVIHLLLMWNRNLCGEHNYTNCVVIKKSSKKKAFGFRHKIQIFEGFQLDCIVDTYIGFVNSAFWDCIQIWKHSTMFEPWEINRIKCKKKTHLHSTFFKTYFNATAKMTLFSISGTLHPTDISPS